MTVPDVVGDAEADALVTLGADGLKAGDKVSAYDGKVGKGKIISTNPKAGVVVQRGTAIDYRRVQGPSTHALTVTQAHGEADRQAHAEADRQAHGEPTPPRQAHGRSRPPSHDEPIATPPRRAAWHVLAAEVVRDR